MYFVHVGVTFFVPWGWLLPWPEAWWFGLFFIPTMLVHWMTADVCILTTIEMKLRGHPQAGTREQGGFIQRMGALIGWHMSDRTAANMGWGLSYMGLALCFLRLYLGDHLPW
ncbi:MAG: hypothetical protein CMB37_00485 [Euryarchaeota archaeon]|nr:hypothetical protein [Euryarchaeota archaeon]